MNGAVCPCAVCEERFVGCHAQCEAYKDWDAEQWKRREAEIQQRRREALLDSAKTDAIRKQRRRRK